MDPAAILSVLVSAPTQEASANLTKFDAQMRTVQRVAEKGIHARLGGTFNSDAFRQYEERLSQASRRTMDRKAFKAELGANFNNAAFNAYERAVLKAERETQQLVATQETAAVKMRRAAGQFFTGSKTAGSEERSFARGTLRGTIGRGAGFLGGGLAGGVLGYVSATGIKDSIESTTQMVKQAEILAHYTGISQQNAMALEGVSKALGVSSKGLGVGFRTLATAANNALSDPTKASVRAFKELGISQDELKSHAGNLQATFGLVADQLNKLPPGAEKTALAAKLLGRNWQTLAPLVEQGSKGMKDQLAQAKALGVTLGGDPLKNIQKLHEAEIRLKLSQEALSVQFTEHFAPALISGVDGAIKLAGTIRRDLSPVFHELSPVVKDVGHFLDQNRTAVELLAGAFVGLKVIRTVGGWFGGLYNDARKVWEVGGKLAGLFREQGAAAASEVAPVNELAAAYERLALAQRESGFAGSAAATEATAAGLTAGRFGAGAVASRLLPAAGAALLGYEAFHSFLNPSSSGPGGLAAQLGPTVAYNSFHQPAGLHMSANAGDLLSAVNPLGSHFLQPKFVADSGTRTANQLSLLRKGLKNVGDATQLTDAQLAKYGQIVAGLSKQPDLTSTQRKGLAKLAYELKPTTVAFQRATATWSATFAGFDATNGNMSRHFRDQLAQDSHQISQNWTRGTSQWTQQVTALTASAWAQIQQMSAAGVSGVGQDIQSLVAMIDQAQITVTRAGRNWLSAIQANLAPGLGKALANAQRNGGAASGWDITAHTRKAAALHEYWNPITGMYEKMTSAHHSALRDQYIAMYGKAAPSGPGSAAAAAGTTTTTSAAAPPAPTAIPSQSIIAQIQMAQLANKLAAAQNTGNMAAQARALQGELKLEHRWLSADTSKLAEVNWELKNHNLGYAKHNQLLQDKLSILQEIGNVVGQINSTQQTAGAAASVGAKMPKVYYHDHPRHGRQTIAGTVKAGATSGIRNGGLSIGQVVIHGNNMNERQMMDELYLKIRPHLTSPAG